MLTSKTLYMLHPGNPPMAKATEFDFGEAKPKPSKSGKPPFALSGKEGLYTKDRVEKVLQLAAQGITETKICRKLGIGMQSLWHWKKAHPDFAEAMLEARKVQDQIV